MKFSLDDVVVAGAGVDDGDGGGVVSRQNKGKDGEIDIAALNGRLQPGIQGSDIFPPPEFPNNLLIWIFIAYMAIGALWLLAVKIVNPTKLQALSGNPHEICGDQK